MSDATNAASRADSAPSNPRATAPWRHRWLPLVTLVVMGIALVAIQFLPEQIDRGSRRIFSVIAVVLAGGVLAAWYFALSGAAMRWRAVVGAALVLAVVGAVGSLRRVEFTGDMVPSFDFRWSRDRAEVLEAHRAGRSDVSEQPVALGDLSPGPLDVLDFRGAKRDGVIAGPKLARDWKARPPKLVWRQPVGGGYASFVVIGPLAITIEQRRGDEAIVAYDVNTGREQWIHQYPALFSEKLGGDGPRATPTIHGDRVISLGATGELVSLELASGKPIWRTNVLEQNHSGNLDWGMSGSPLVVADLVVVNAGNQKGGADSRAITAFDLSDGKPRFAGGATKAGYTSPMLVTLAGKQQLLIFDGEGLAGFDPADGRELWRTAWKSDFEINASQPVVLDLDQVFITSAAGAALIKVTLSGDQWSAEEVWRNRKLKASYASPIVHQGYVYGLDDGIMACLDLATGLQKWKARGGRYGAGQMLLVGDLLLVQAESGELALVEPRPEQFIELGRFQAIDGKTWNNPTYVGGRVLVRNHLEMAAYDLPLAETEPEGEPAR